MAKTMNMAKITNSDKLTSELFIDYRRLIISYSELDKALGLVKSALNRIDASESLCDHHDKVASEIIDMMNEIADDIKPTIDELFKRTHREAEQ